jgi:hypothetical protein
MKIYENRNMMVNDLITPNGVYAEIGVFKGEFSKFLLTLNPTQLVLFDLFNGSCGSGDVDGNNFCSTNMANEYNNIINWNNQAIILKKGDSSSQLACFPNEYFDMIYIDGDHSYEGCKKDLDVALQKIKIGGYIMGHDYEMNMNKAKTNYSFGVKKAVDEFCEKNNLQLAAKGNDGCVSYAIAISN